jgi:hypothetical protein
MPRWRTAVRVTPGAAGCWGLQTLHFDVGILRKDWLANATLLGEDTTDSFEVNVSQTGAACTRRGQQQPAAPQPAPWRLRCSAACGA